MERSALDIVRANEADIPFIMATERTTGYDELVGRWERDQHERELADTSNAYFVGLIGGTPAGFVIVQHWAAPTGATLIRRVAVAETGRKIGRALLSAVIDRVFAETAAQRVWLNVFPHNVRAQRSYRALGFRFEAREGSDFPGSGKSLLMVIQRHAWRSS